MTEIGSLFPSEIAVPLGWSLIHSLWQGSVIAVLAWFLMSCSRRPSIRYLVGVTALALMVTTFAATLTALMQGLPTFGTSGNATSRVQDFIGSALPAVAQISPLAGVSATISLWPVSRFMPLLVAAWLLGLTLFCFRLMLGMFLLEQRRRWRSSELAEHFVKLCQEVQDRVGLEKVIRYMECDWLQAPAVIGWLRPVVMLPATVLTGLSEDQLRAVIAHELAHIKRLDYVANFLQALVEALFFYHPAIWWLGKRIRTERELCCDKIAVSLYDNRLEYARALGLMGEWRSAPPLALAANRGPLAERILCVLGRETAIYKPSPVAAGFLLLMVIFSASRVMPDLEAGFLAEAFTSKTAVPNNIAAQAAPEWLEKSGISLGQPHHLDAQKALPRPQKAVATAHHVLARPLPVLAEETFQIAPTLVIPAREPVDQAGLQVASSRVVAASENDARQADQPTGSGDPDAVSCRKPRRLAGTQTMEPELCRKNAYWSELWIRGEILGADGNSVQQPAAARVVDGTPDGAGAPDEVVCARPQQQSASRLLIPTRCFRNAYWARLFREFPETTLTTNSGRQFSAVSNYPLPVGYAAN